MTKKKKEIKVVQNSNNIIEQQIDVTLKTNYMPYAMYVIASRALPDVYDGLKPIHRRILVTANKMKLTTKGKTKSANLVGQIMKLHPHGDSYESIVRLVDCNESLLVPYLTGKGNFSKVYFRDTSYAADRYTETGMLPYGYEFFHAIDNDVVDFIDNYDGKLKEPIVLPVRFPNILINPNMGIAVGMASNICSFNFNEIADSVILLLEDNNSDIFNIIKGPDFPTGGEYLFDKESLHKVIDTGKGVFTIRAKYKYDKKSNCIEIYEIPYTTTIETICDKITDLVKNKKIKDILDVRDESSLSGLQLAIDVKKGTDIPLLMEKLYKLTPLEDNFNCNFNVLVDGSPQVLGVKEILKIWIDWRIRCIKREYQFNINKLKDKLHLLEGLNKTILSIDEVIQVIRNCKKEKDIPKDLQNSFNLTATQAEYIGELKLKNINKFYFEKQIKEQKSIERELNKSIKIINNDKKIKEIIKLQIEEMKTKYGSNRKTTISKKQPNITLSEIDFVDNYKCSIVLTNDGYLKKNIRYNETQLLKEGDTIINTSHISNNYEYLIFTSLGNVYPIKVYQLKECTPSSLGDYLPTTLKMNKNENVIGGVAIENYDGYLIFVFENGKISKVPLSEYKTKSKKLTKGICLEQSIVKTISIHEDCKIKILSNYSKEFIVNTKDLTSVQTKNSKGVSIGKLRKDGIIIDAEIIKKETMS